MKHYASLEYVAIDRRSGKRSHVRLGRLIRDEDAGTADAVRWARSVPAA